jgi:hypothetical protein
MKRGARVTAGFSLLEAVVSVALSLTLLAAAVPLAGRTVRLSADLCARGLRAEAGRLAAVRLVREARRAGFGLPADGEGLAHCPDGLCVRTACLRGGFDGCRRPLAAVAAGAARFRLAGLGEISAGDDVVVADREGRSYTARVLRTTSATAEVEIDPALPFALESGENACVFPIERRAWEETGGALERDGVTAIDPTVRLRLAPTTAAFPPAVLADGWPEGGVPPSAEPAAMTAGLLTVIGRSPLTEPGRPAGEVRLSLAVRPRNDVAVRSSGSPLP